MFLVKFSELRRSLVGHVGIAEKRFDVRSRVQVHALGEIVIAGIKDLKKPKHRRPNWGLPDAAATAVGYTRPIRISCSAGELIVLPERGAATQEGPEQSMRIVIFSRSLGSAGFQET